MSDPAPATPRRGARKTTETTTSLSVRLPNETLAGLKAKAERDGVKTNRVMIELAEGYRRGIYRLPKSRTKTERVYPTSGIRPPETAPSQAATAPAQPWESATTA